MDAAEGKAEREKEGAPEPPADTGEMQAYHREYRAKHRERLREKARERRARQKRGDQA